MEIPQVGDDYTAEFGLDSTAELIEALELNPENLRSDLHCVPEIGLNYLRDKRYLNYQFWS